MIRPDLRPHFARHAETALALALAALGLWVAWQGGFLLLPAGLVLAALASAWAFSAHRRARFDQGHDAPGLVEVDEGRITYFGPEGGGSVGLPELADLRLVTLRGRRLWRLRQGDGETLLIPVEAHGAAALFDAFAALPGMDTGALVAALGRAGDGAGDGLPVTALEMRPVWVRPGAGMMRPDDAGPRRGM